MHLDVRRDEEAWRMEEEPQDETKDPSSLNSQDHPSFYPPFLQPHLSSTLHGNLDFLNPTA